MSIFPQGVPAVTAPSSTPSSTQYEPRLNQAFKEADSLKGVSIVLLIFAVLAFFGIIAGGIVLIGYGLFILRKDQSRLSMVLGSALIALGGLNFLSRYAPNSILIISVVLAFGLSLYSVVKAHQMIGFLKDTGRTDPSWPTIRKKVGLTRVLCSISAGLLGLILMLACLFTLLKFLVPEV